MPNSKETKDIAILFVINPISGDTEKDDLISELQQFSKTELFSYEIFYTTGKDDAQKIAAKLEESTYNKVVAVGGDGTCNLVARHLINTSIQLGIIPKGSANGLANELMLPTTIKEALRTAIKGKIKKIDVVRINQDKISLHLSDIGLNAKVVKRFENDKTRGFLGYAKHFFKELKITQPTKFKLITDQEIIQRKANMVVIANASRYGTGAIINPEGKIDDGKFEVIFVRPYSFLQMLKMIIPFYTRRIHTLDYVDTFSCKNAVIHNVTKQVLQVDGEVIGPREKISVECIPQSLNVVVPKTKPLQRLIPDINTRFTE